MTNAEQVRYGQWYLIRSDKEETAEMCSICSGTIVRKSYHKAYEYCTHCGIKMKKEWEDAETLIMRFRGDIETVNDSMQTLGGSNNGKT